MKNLAMSTAWNSSRHTRAEDMLQEILELGIRNIEAGYLLSSRLLQGLEVLMKTGRFQVNSIHNFCPTPVWHKCSWGDDYLLSSMEEEKRNSGVRSTLETFVWAAKLKAKVIVMHLGKVEMPLQDYDQLLQRVSIGEEKSTACERLVGRIKKERALLAKPYFNAVRRSLDELIPQLPAGTILGVENRYEYYSFPILEEFELLFNEYGDKIGYWHDTGHAHTLEYLGFYSTSEYIRSLGKKLVGLHLHDAQNLRDHQPIGNGKIDFSSLLPFLHDKVLKVLELHGTKEEVLNGISHLKRIGILNT